MNVLNFIYSNNKCESCFLYSVILIKGSVATYPFSKEAGSRDISQYKNPAARLVGISYTRGPDQHPQGAYYFPGVKRIRGRTRTSYVLIPNNGCLDTRFSLTVLCWVYGQAPGTLIHFNPKGAGVDLSLSRLTQLYFRVVPRGRSGRSVKPLIGNGLKPNTWSYIAATYDQRTGLATLFINSYPVAQKHVGKFRNGLATEYPILIGKSPGNRRMFRGRLACVQIFNVALTRIQIVSQQKKCFRPSKFYNRFKGSKILSLCLSCFVLLLVLHIMLYITFQRSWTFF